MTSRPPRPQRPADVGERRAGVVEEHRAEPADRQVEALPRERVDLRVGALEADVAQPLGAGELAGTFDRGRGDVDPERIAFVGSARGLPRRLPGAASDVEDMVAGPDAAGTAQYLVMPP